MSSMPTVARPRMTADQRRAAIVLAAVAEFARTGYEGTSTDAIARRAGITQPYVMRLFGTKRDLFVAAVDHAYGAVLDAFREAAESAAPGDRMDAICASYWGILADRDLLAMQFQAMAASDDSIIRAVVARHVGVIRAFVVDETGAGEQAMREFMAMGMLMNAAVALDMPDLIRAGGWDAVLSGSILLPMQASYRGDP